MTRELRKATLVDRQTSDENADRPGAGQAVQMLFDFDSPADPTAAGTVPVHDRPECQFALRFAALLEAEAGTAFDNPALSRLARDIFGSSVAHARDAYDAAEAGFNIYLERVGLDLGDVRNAMDKLLAEQARLPTQTRRSQDQIDFQQFSTPPAQALLVGAAAALRPGMIVLEPSAGTGNIAVLARLAGADVDTNEIDERRRSLLSLQGFESTAFDAERLDNLLPADKFYDVVVMNAPFSATGGRVKGHSTHFGARHVEQALLRLKPGGRLVAIVGRGMALDRPAFRAWWAQIEQRFRVRANIGIDGSVYAKFGTTFDNQVIVIDHDGRALTESDIVTGSGLSVQTAYELLKPLSQEDVYGRIRKQDQATGRRRFEAHVPARIASRHEPGGHIDGVPAGGWSGGRSIAARRAGDDRAVAHVEPASDGSPAGIGTHDDVGSAARANNASIGCRRDEDLGGSFTAEHARSAGDGVGQLETAVAPQALHIEAGTVFAAYRVQKAIVRGAQRSVIRCTSAKWRTRSGLCKRTASRQPTG